MQSFKLEGMKFPHKPEQISICPFIDENCCTVMDELTILKYWNEFSMEKWKKFVSYIVYLIGNIINFQPFVRRLGIHNVPFFFSKGGFFEYLTYSCDVTAESSHTIPFNLVRTKMTKRIRNLKLTMLRDIFNNDTKKVDRYLREEKKQEKKHLKNKKSSKQLIIDGFSEVQRKRFLKKMSKEERAAYIAANSIKMKADESNNKAQYRFLRDVRVMSKAIERKLSNSFQRLKNKMAEALDNYEEFLSKSKLNYKPILEKYQKNVEDFIDKGKFYIEQMPDMVRYDFKSFQTFMNSVKALMIDNLEAAYNVMEKGGGRTRPDFMVKLLNKVKLANLPKILIPKIPNLTLPEIEVDPLKIPKIQCWHRNIPQQRNLFVINSPKLEYCSNALDRVLQIKMRDYTVHLNLVKTELLRLISVKKGLYCVLCDADSQHFIDKKANMILLDRTFCGNYIADFQEYFRFVNVFFIEYLDAIFQFINCVSTPGDELDFPFFTIIEKKKRMIALWEMCFDAIGTEDEFKNCYFICEHFKYDRNTPTIEGDVEFLKTVYFEIISFMRKNTLTMVKTIGRSQKKINWNMQDSLLVQKNKHFRIPKHQDEISKWHLKKAHEQIKAWENERILEQEETKEPEIAPKCSHHDEEYEKLLHENPNLYDDNSIFFKPSTVHMMRSTMGKRILQEDRKLWINPKPLVQGTDPYITEVQNSLDLDKMKEEFHEEQLQKQLAKEEATPVEREVKKDEIFERIEMTVDLSVMDLIYLKEGDGINPLKMAEAAEFDVSPKKLMQENLKTFGMEILHRNVIAPVVTLTNRKIEKFNDDIDMKVMNSKNLPHKFKNVEDGDWYKLEEDKRMDKMNGVLPPKPDHIDNITNQYENLKLELGKPDPTTLDDEMKKKLEKNPRVKSLWQHFRVMGL